MKDITIDEIMSMKVDGLRNIAGDFGIENAAAIRKVELRNMILAVLEKIDNEKHEDDSLRAENPDGDENAEGRTAKGKHTASENADSRDAAKNPDGDENAADGEAVDTCVDTVGHNNHMGDECLEKDYASEKAKSRENISERVAERGYERGYARNDRSTNGYAENGHFVRKNAGNSTTRYNHVGEVRFEKDHANTGSPERVYERGYIRNDRSANDYAEDGRFARKNSNGSIRYNHMGGERFERDYVGTRSSERGYERGYERGHARNDRSERGFTERNYAGSGNYERDYAQDGHRERDSSHIENTGESYSGYTKDTENGTELEASENIKNGDMENRVMHASEAPSDGIPVDEVHAGRIDIKEKEKPTYTEAERPTVDGILDVSEQGYGFLRFKNFLSSDKDIYVSATQIKRFSLKTGDRIVGISRHPNEGERFGALLYVNTVNGDEPGVAMRRKPFERLTPIFPYEKLTLENDPKDISTRILDLASPIGKGQRGLIVAPPKSGKTVLLKRVANAIEKNHPDIEIIILLIDERPEEVTDIERSIESASVIFSTFDEQPEHHVKVAEMVMARAQRLAEHGKDVVILLDSITRLARAYNMVIPSTGKTLSGGLDPGALHKPKKFFGTARKLEEGGSVTILASALVETGSRMDDVIYEEFKGTGNMELHLDRKLAERRIYPAIELSKSSTRREELLLNKEEKSVMWNMRRLLANQNNQDTAKIFIEQLEKTTSNEQFVRKAIVSRMFEQERRMRSAANNRYRTNRSE